MNDECFRTLYLFLLANVFIPANPGLKKVYFSIKVVLHSSMAAFKAEYCSRPEK